MIVKILPLNDVIAEAVLVACKLPINIDAVKVEQVNVDVIGLYVNGSVALSINNWFDVADVVLLNGIKHVVFEYQ